MTTWTPELKQEIIDEYLEAGPTPETSPEIVKAIAEERDMSPNAIRQVLVQSGKYLKKEVTDSGKTSTKSKESSGTKRGSKEEQIGALKAAITAVGHEVDDDILDKLTGKAAVYLTAVINKTK